MRTFQGREISKSTISIGIGGQIYLPQELPALGSVLFQARASVGATKYKYVEGNACEEIVILTVDKDSFTIIEVERAAEQLQLPASSQGTVSPAETEQVIRDMGLRKDECAQCHHLKENHDEGAHHCAVAGCECPEYLAEIPEAPAEDDLEPADEPFVVLCAQCSQALDPDSTDSLCQACQDKAQGVPA